jgi:hypothetical protein
MNAWESIFTQSPVNNGCYAEDELQQQNWSWPTGTWFQTRLDGVRERTSHQPKSNRRISDTDELRTM